MTRPSADGTRRFPRVHDLRHAAASILLTEGFAPHEVQAILGHSSSQTTLRIYAHVISESVKAKAVALDGSLEEAVSRARGENVIPIQSHSVAG
jgi:integrase